MKKAAITGFFTGVVISAILICGTYLRRFLPNTFTANLLFLTLFFGSIVAVLWTSLSYYSRRIRVKWRSLTMTGIISSIIAATLVSFHTFLYSRFKDPYYFEEIMQLSKQKLQSTNNAAGNFVDNLASMPSHVYLALTNFKDLMIVLFLISLVIAAVYYVRYRNRVPDHPNTKNQELIF